IGGSFRVPEVMAQSGCILKEVGATNKTKLSDYEQAIGPNTGLLLKVHTSNYRIVGFTQEVGLADLVELGKRYQLPVMEDLGSGFLVDLAARGIGDEPTVQASIAAGADVVTFSGDKLLGGPQAGIIVGKKSLLDKMKKHPLNRALRIDKMTVAALQATLLAYLEPEGVWQEIPTLRLLTLTADQIQDRAESLATSLRTVLHDKAEVQVVAEVSEVGGGAMPLTSLPTYAVRIKFVQRDCQLMAERLRQQDRPILVRIKDEGILLDLRTVLPGEEKMILSAFTSLMEGESR
ncbi:L-seryl-tRNA(Sec) selenium transferase, partial [Carboxydocella sp. JDF658]